MENNSLLHSFPFKSTYLTNLNSAKFCVGGLGRGHPPEVDVEAQSQGMGADGRASNRAHGLLREECFVVLVF